MSTTRFADACDALLAALATAPALAGIPVHDGTVITAAADLEFIVVGHDGSVDPSGVLAGTAPAGTYAQNWIDTTSPQQETGFINCLIVSQTGDPADVAARRQRVKTLTAAVEDVAAAGGRALTTGLTFDGVTGGQYIYQQASSGMAVLHTFRLSYSTAW